MKLTSWPYNREVHFHSSIVLGSRPVASVFVRKAPLYLYRRYYRCGLEIQRDNRLRRPTLCPEPWRAKSQDPDSNELDRSRIVPANEAVPVLRTSMGSLLRPRSFQIIVGHEVRIILELAEEEPYRNLLLEMAMEGTCLAVVNTAGKNRCYLTRCKSNVYHDFYIYYYYKLGEKDKNVVQFLGESWIIPWIWHFWSRSISALDHQLRLTEHRNRKRSIAGCMRCGHR